MAEAPIERAPETRRLLLDAAVEVFLEKGYLRSGVAEIAKRAGLTTGAIYNRWPSKAALLAEAVAEQGASALRDAPSLPDASRAVDDAAAMDAALLCGAPTALDHLVIESWAAALHDDDAAAMVRGSLREIVERIDAAIAEGTARGRHRAGVDAAAKRTYLLALILGGYAMRVFELPRAEPAAMALFLRQIIASWVEDDPTIEPSPAG